MLGIETVAVLGAGRDAVRAALLCSLAGLDVRLSAEEAGALDGAFKALRHDVEQALSGGLIGREERQRILDGILFTPDLDEAVAGADLVYAADAADATSALQLLQRLARSCRATALLATSADPSAIAGSVLQPGRVVALALEDDDLPLPRLALRAGSTTTTHARARGEQFVERVNRAGGKHR
ncbi:MAG: 3-hydroxyacyl-CoA dehydrogenase NAD-binding domain-containing protein [Anaeromyxobacteraceae bacterium]